MSELAIYRVEKLISIVITLQLTVFMQLKHSFSIIVIFNCCHFATDCLHAVKMLVFYYCHFQLLSFCNCPSSHSESTCCVIICSFLIVVTLQLTIFITTSSSQYTVLRYIFSVVKLSQFLKYLPIHAL